MRQEGLIPPAHLKSSVEWKKKSKKKEAEAQAFADIASDTGSNDAEEFEKLENDSKVNSELERLKAEMGL